jgi:hypothetical protein
MRISWHVLSLLVGLHDKCNTSPKSVLCLNASQRSFARTCTAALMFQPFLIASALSVDAARAVPVLSRVVTMLQLRAYVLHVLDAPAAFHTFVQHGAAIGITLSLHKCAVYGIPSTPAYMAARQSARILDIQHAADGLAAARTRIGTDDYIAAHMEDCADQPLHVSRSCRTSHHP